MNSLKVPYVALLGNHDCLGNGENIFEEITDEVLELKRSGSKQLVVTIPDRTGLKDKNFIMRHIKESIGIKI